MAVINLPTQVSLVTPNADDCQVCKGYAAQTLNAGTACYVTSTGTIAPAAAIGGFTQPVVGWTVTNYNQGEMVTLFQDVKVVYRTTSTLTAGTFLFMGAVAGTLDDTQINGCPAVARVLYDNSVSFSGNRQPLLWLIARL